MSKRTFSERGDVPSGVPRISKKSWKAVTAGIHYYEQGKFGKALPLLFQYEGVEARAMFLLACMYSNGLGVWENMVTASSYLLNLVNLQNIRREEENLQALAHFYLGDLYYRGVVFATDRREAEKHWRQGAVMNRDPETDRHHFGTMKCQEALGMLYSSPDSKNIKKAFYWHKKAAESGSIVSEGALGVMYMYGIGTDENRGLAYDLLTNAAAADNTYAKGYLAAFYYRHQMFYRTVCLGGELSAMADYDSVAKREGCFVDHVKQGVAVGCFYRALCLQYGYAIEKNLEEAKKLIKKALELSAGLTCDLHVNAIMGTA